MIYLKMFGLAAALSATFIAVGGMDWSLFWGITLLLYIGMCLGNVIESPDQQDQEKS